MRLTFLGTKGYIKPRSKRHEMHTCMMVSHGGKRVLIDCGESWRKKIFKLRPHQIVLTHAHPDHAYGLDEGAPCTVWAPKQTWKLINDFPIEKRQRKTIPLRKPIKIAGITFEAFDVIHSLKCPAVGYRITASKVSVFYVPDVIWIHRQAKALKGVRLYIGDGATVQGNMVRKDKETGKIFGHTNVRQQLYWCKKESVPKMIVTHCGSDIVKREKTSLRIIQGFAEKRDVDVVIAYDGMKLNLR